MNVEKDTQLLREIGIKLANFRKKLALAIGQKKITQLAFGEMFGYQSPRQVTSYERGEVDPPVSLLYLIWRSGNSLDGIFTEQPITDTGTQGAKRLYENLALEAAKRMDEQTLARAIKEAENVKAGHDKTPKKTTIKPSGKTKERNSKTRTAKKR